MMTRADGLLALATSTLLAIGFLAGGGAANAQTAPLGGHAAVAPGSDAGWTHHGPFHVCPDAGSNTGCMVETGVRVRAGNRVEVRARGRVNFGGGVPLSIIGPVVGVPPPPGARAGDALRGPDGEAARDPTYPAPDLRKNSLLVMVAQPVTALPGGGKSGNLYQGGTSAAFTVGETGELVLLTNDARTQDNRAVCEAGLCGWEVTLDVYDAPPGGAPPPPTAGPPPLPGGPQAPAGPVAVGTGAAGGGSQPPSPPPSAPAVGASRPEDVQGSGDHPLVPRARGAIIRTYDVKKLDGEHAPPPVEPDPLAIAERTGTWALGATAAGADRLLVRLEPGRAKYDARQDLGLSERRRSPAPRGHEPRGANLFGRAYTTSR
jgi:hypothetical protein